MIWIFSFREIAAASPCGTWILSVHQTRLLGRRFYAFPGRLGTVSFLWTVNGSFAVFCHSPNTHSNLRTLSQIIPDTGNGACAQSYNGARVTDDTFLECRHNRAKLGILFLKIDILFCGIQLGSGRLSLQICNAECEANLPQNAIYDRGICLQMSVWDFVTSISL